MAFSSIYKRRYLAAVVFAAAMTGCVWKHNKSKADFAEYSYPSMFGTAEIFTLKSESGALVRVLNVGGAFQSATYLGKKRFEPVFEYYRAFDHMFDYSNNPKTILMIGGGGFSYPKHLLTSKSNASIDVVESDPAIVNIARKHFYLDELEQKYGEDGKQRLNIYVADGLNFFNESHGKRYDVIINDAFDGANPAVGLLTSTALNKAKQRLTSNGLYMLNAVISAEDTDMLQTYMEVLLEGFSNVYAIKCVEEEFAGEDNWLLIASDGQHRFDSITTMVTR